MVIRGLAFALTLVAVVSAATEKPQEGEKTASPTISTITTTATSTTTTTNATAVTTVSESVSENATIIGDRGSYGSSYQQVDPSPEFICSVFGGPSCPNSKGKENEPCTCEGGHKCECVPYYQCDNTTGAYNKDGVGVIDIRQDKEDSCPHYMDKCCTVGNILHPTLPPPGPYQPVEPPYNPQPPYKPVDPSYPHPPTYHEQHTTKPGPEYTPYPEHPPTKYPPHYQEHPPTEHMPHYPEHPNTEYTPHYPEHPPTKYPPHYPEHPPTEHPPTKYPPHYPEHPPTEHTPYYPEHPPTKYPPHYPEHPPTEHPPTKYPTHYPEHPPTQHTPYYPEHPQTKYPPPYPEHPQHPEYPTTSHYPEYLKPSPYPPQNHQCGQRNPEGVGVRITGDEGGEAQFGEFPWMLAILKEVDGESNRRNLYVCGASLITPSVVITAAHCVKDKRASSLKIRAGEWDTQTANEIYKHQDRKVEKIIVHPNYYGGAVHNDVALLILHEPINVGYHIGLTCMPEQHQSFDYSKCFVSGWGKDKFGKDGQYQVILKKLELPIVPRQECQKKLRHTRLGHHFELHDSFICAGGEPGIDACKGDGGSPLVCPMKHDPNRYQLAGMVAWGIDCGLADVPGVYVNVGLFRHWVDEELRKLHIYDFPYQA